MAKIGKMRLFFSLIMLLFLSVEGAKAASVSFQVIQHDPSQKKLRAASSEVETDLLNNFFDQGHVVTNFPTAISSDEAEDKAIYYGSLDEAKEGRCGYFAVIIIEYDVSASYNPEALILRNIKHVSWELFDARSGESLGSGKQVAGKLAASRDNKYGIVILSKNVAGDIAALLPKGGW